MALAAAAALVNLPIRGAPSAGPLRRNRLQCVGMPAPLQLNLRDASYRSLNPTCGFIGGLANRWFKLHQVVSDATGGEGGIRTHESLAALPVFETGPFNRSGTSPDSMQSRYRFWLRPLPLNIRAPRMLAYAATAHESALLSRPAHSTALAPLRLSRSSAVRMKR
jgi:hypothetical protein